MAATDTSRLKLRPGSAATKRFTSADGRRFALTVASALAVLAAILYWRDRDMAAKIIGALSGLFCVAALVAPSRLEHVEKAWMGLARAMSKVTTPIFMGVIYFGVLSPFAVIRRAMGKNALVRRRDAKTYWVERDRSADAGRRRRRMERQF